LDSAAALVEAFQLVPIAEAKQMPDKSTAATQPMGKMPHPLSPSPGLPTSMPDQPI